MGPIEDELFVSVQRLTADGRSYEQIGTGMVLIADVVLLKLPVPSELSRPGSPEGEFRVVVGPADPQPGTVVSAAVTCVHVATVTANEPPLVAVTVRGPDPDQRRQCPIDGASAGLDPTESDSGPSTVADQLARIEQPDPLWVKAAEATLPPNPDRPERPIRVLPPAGDGDDLAKWLCKKLGICSADK